MTTITQVIDAVNNPPSIDDPTNFETEAEDFLVNQITGFQTQANTWAGQANTMAGEMNDAVAKAARMAGAAIGYAFSTTTTDSDPGAGTLRLGAATQNTSTVIRADLVDDNGVTVTALLDALDDSTSTTKGLLRLQHRSDTAKWLLFEVTAVASPSGYRNISVTCIASSGANPFGNTDPIALTFAPAGQKGDTGNQGTTDLQFLDHGNSGTTAQVLDYSAKQHHKITATGAFTLTTTGWPSVNTGIQLLEAVNFGSQTVTIGETWLWEMPNGTTTTSFSTYMAAIGISGRTTWQSAGTDFVLLRRTGAGSVRARLIA